MIKFSAIEINFLIDELFLNFEDFVFVEGLIAKII